MKRAAAKPDRWRPIARAMPCRVCRGNGRTRPTAAERIGPCPHDGGEATPAFCQDLDECGRAILVDLESAETLWGEGFPAQSVRHEARFKPCMRACRSGLRAPGTGTASMPSPLGCRFRSACSTPLSSSPGDRSRRPILAINAFASASVSMRDHSLGKSCACSRSPPYL